MLSRAEPSESVEGFICSTIAWMLLWWRLAWLWGNHGRHVCCNFYICVHAIAWQWEVLSSLNHIFMHCCPLQDAGLRPG